jgi:hypothetical protein
VGIKWNVTDGFKTAYFSFTLDDDYPVSLMPIAVLAKSGPNFDDGLITGPDCSITAIELVSFSAVRNGDNVALNWETAVEIDNVGFNLYRAAAPDGPYVKINSQLIAAEGNGTGASYHFSDAVGLGRYDYLLEDIDTSGVATQHIPVSAAAEPGPNRIFLPLIGVAK